MKPRVITSVLIAAATLWLVGTDTVSAWAPRAITSLHRIAWVLMTPVAQARQAPSWWSGRSGHGRVRRRGDVGG
jgi:hypothetical protein